MNRLTNQREFNSDDAVIEYALNYVHQDLKKRGLL